MAFSKTRLLFSLTCIATLAAAAPILQAADRITRDFEVSPGGLLTIEAVQGSIEINSHEGRDLKIEIIPRDLSDFEKRFDVQFNQTGNQIRLEVESKNKISGWFNWGNKGFKIVASVPYEFDLDLKTSGGGVVVDAIKGEVRAGTSGGSLHFGQVEGSIFGRTSGGSIEVNDCTGKANVRTSGGGINIGKVDGTVEAVTSGGSIRIESGGESVVAETSGGNIWIQEVRGSLDASTAGGSIEATLTEQPSSDCSLKTSGGSIKVWLAEDLGLELDARTSGGRVQSDLPLTVQGVIGKAEVKGQLNQGGPKLVLRTSGGGIQIGRATVER